ncbi:MAG: TadE/TadG family type IV pilus assembly protein [Acidimicrobiales bacterium]
MRPSEHQPASDAKSPDQRGAAMVEFALIAPILLGLLFGIIEFGWTFSQVLDTRHGAREGARLVAVNYHPTGSTGTTQTDEIVAEICGRVDDPQEYRIEITLAASGANQAGDLALVRVERNLEQLSGFYDPFLKNVVPNSEVNFRLEQEATWAETTTAQSCP